MRVRNVAQWNYFCGNIEKKKKNCRFVKKEFESTFQRMVDPNLDIELLMFV